jgi:hypothetical protein
MKILPAWMYRDPAEVVERVELTELRAEARARVRELEREQEFRAARKRLDCGVLTAATVRLINRVRIRSLVRQVLKERK